LFLEYDSCDMKIITLSKIPTLSPELRNIPFEYSESEGVHFFPEGVQAGFPSPANDFSEQKLSLDARYLTKPNSTFIIQVVGNSMYPTLQENDLLIVRSDLVLEDRKVCIVSVNHTDFTVKRFDKTAKKLIADNPDFEDIEIAEQDILYCLGVVETFFRDL